MLGLAGEYLATKLIEKIDAFLLKNETSLQATYQTALQNKRVISQRYLMVLQKQCMLHI